MFKKIKEKCIAAMDTYKKYSSGRELSPNVRRGYKFFLIGISIVIFALLLSLAF